MSEADQLVVLVGASALVATRQPRGGRLLTVVAPVLLAVVAVGLVRPAFPGVRAELNPVEGLWSSLKAVELANSLRRRWTR